MDSLIIIEQNRYEAKNQKHGTKHPQTNHNQPKAQIRKQVYP